ncbi:MAG TPA: hypothetical protein VMV26_13010 [Alphaproteobacteria bacterium]|jgi:hypothetical protein|nr:hypothetical protein [Alphaproteobacteria bacterium]
MPEDKISAGSADAIFAAATEMKDRFDALIDGIDDEVDKIFDAASSAGREPNAAEKARIDQLGADQAKLRKSQDALAFATLRKLDNSADVVALQSQLQTVNAGLKDCLGRLRKIAAIAQIAAKVADGLTQLAEKAAGALV